VIDLRTDWARVAADLDDTGVAPLGLIFHDTA
jgi:hypothetical protein